MKPSEVAAKAISRFNKRITNEVFLTIQNDRALMRDYLCAVRVYGGDEVNKCIGKEVKKTYHLANADDREDNPSCTLIQTHQKFE